MNENKLAIFIFLLLLFLSGCSKTSSIENIEIKENVIEVENSDLELQVVAPENWMIEKATKNNVKLKKDDIVAIVTSTKKSRTLAELKQELLLKSGQVTLLGEGLNFISWKSDRKESIQTNIWIEEEKNRFVFITVITPDASFEKNSEAIERFRKQLIVN